MFAPVLTLLAALGSTVSCSPASKFRDASHYGPSCRPGSSDTLASYALQKVLSDASPIFGYYVDSSARTANWMKAYDDCTELVHMNIPGTHDSQTWNYTLATQQALLHITNLNGVVEYPPQIFQTQDMPIIAMLNAGIRAFDLRFAYDATNSTLVFYHSEALQSETATVDDVLFGFFQWLDDHPSETVLLSFNYEGSTKKYASFDVSQQLAIFNTLTSPAAKHYFLQTKGAFGTLGAARGKVILLQRFDLTLLPQSYSDALPGMYFSPNLWTDNGAYIPLVYNQTTNATAYIEDFYDIGSPIGSGAALNIQWELNATIANIVRATTTYPDSLFWTFASSEYDTDTPPETPRIMAVGNGTALTPLGGVNQRLLPFLQQQRGKRVGLIMFDFFDIPGNLIETMLSLQDPSFAS